MREIILTGHSHVSGEQFRQATPAHCAPFLHQLKHDSLGKKTQAIAAIKLRKQTPVSGPRKGAWDVAIQASESGTRLDA